MISHSFVLYSSSALLLILFTGILVGLTNLSK